MSYWGKNSNTIKKMTEEDCFSSDSSSEDSSHDSRNQQYVSIRKENVSSRLSKKCPGNRDEPVHCFKPWDPCEGDQRTTFSSRAKPHVCKPSSPTHKREDPCDTGTGRDTSLDDIWKEPMTRRKTRHQFQKEKEAAITIQSAWRGYQVRREMDTLEEAATRIQAVFRGYLTRKELPFPLYVCDNIPGQKSKKKMRDKIKSRSFPEVLSEQLGLVPRCQDIFLQSGQQGSFPKNIVDECIAFQPQVTFLEINSAQRPHKEMFTCDASPVQKQRYDYAASIIQAAWRGHQIRQRASPTMLQGDKSHGKSYCSNFSIEKIYRKHMTSGHTLEHHKVQGIITKSGAESVSFRNVPHIRNINVYTIVKAMPVSSKPSVSIRVSSSHAVVQGYQKDMSRGAHGFYTIKNRDSQKPTQVLVHVNLQKQKGLKNCP